MNISKKALSLLIKIILILIIPYYLVTFSTRNTSDSSIVGTWGQWPEEILASQFPDSFWQSNQIWIALLFMLPLIIFAIVYQQKQVDRKCIGSAVGAISISYIATGLFSPQFYFVDIRYSIANIVPNVVTLSVFVFVFWPLLQNSWPSISPAKDEREEEGGIKKLRNIIANAVPLNAATAVWLALVILPTTLIVSNINISANSVTSVVTLVGGLFSVHHDYLYIMGGGYYPTIYSYFYLIVARWPAVSDLLVLILNLSIGIAAFRFIQGEGTKKRVYILMLLSFLVYAIPNVFTIGFAIRWIPLPIFQIFMFFVVKYVKVPISDSSVDTIGVPLRIRLASKLRREKSSHENSEVPEDVKEQEPVEEPV